MPRPFRTPQRIYRSWNRAVGLSRSSCIGFADRQTGSGSTGSRPELRRGELPAVFVVRRRAGERANQASVTSSRNGSYGKC
ncbi:hypothetical protein [Streptosporangium sp. CA-115845]|uniref:hypothetical protein n=1 Tax=Streptosporangium sp. CA-115845 TaxID=3240071 RepID=UPI003D8CD25C